MFKIPILFLTYNRIKCTKKSLSAILKIKPSIIYISNDGPKNNYLDKKKIEKIRNYFKKINKKIKVKEKYNIHNLGCKKTNLSALNWFFKNEEFGIILEDDCIPTPSFFSFCKVMLKKYQKNKKIFCISGSNFQNKRTITNSYYFSKYNHCWGWATWSDRWKFNNGDISFWPKFKTSYQWNNFHENKFEKKYWNKIFDKVFLKKIDSWAYPWTLSVWKQKGITVTPNTNLVKNIGFGKESTHSLFLKDSIRYLNNKKFKKKITYPKKIIVDKIADNFVFKNHFKGHNYIWPYRLFFLAKIFLYNPLSFFRKLFKTY